MKYIAWKFEDACVNLGTQLDFCMGVMFVYMGVVVSENHTNMQKLAEKILMW